MRTIFRPNCNIGSLELNRAEELSSKRIAEIITAQTEKAGLLINSNISGVIEDDWLVERHADTQLRIRAGSAILEDSMRKLHYISLEEDLIIDVPSADGHYSVFIRYRTTNEEKGNVSVVNGSTTVIGNDGTEFLKVLGANRRIFIDGAGYVVQSVQSANELTLASPYNGSTQNGLKYKVGGWFTSSQPLAEGDNLIYEYDGFEVIFAVPHNRLDWVSLATFHITSNVISSDIDDMRHLRLAETYKRGINTSTYNYIRNGNFSIAGTIHPFRADGWVIDRFVINLASCSLPGDQSYRWIGQKIYIGDSLGKWADALNKATCFSLGIRLAASSDNVLDSAELSVYNWRASEEVSYQDIYTSKGLATSDNRALYKSKGDLKFRISNNDAGRDITKLNVFTKISIKQGTRVIYVQLRVRDDGSSGFLSTTEWVLLRGDEVVAYSPNPEDAIEDRGIGEAAYLLREIFEVDSDGKVMLKTNIYGKNSIGKATDLPILNAGNTIANTQGQSTGGVQTKPREYTPFNDNLDVIVPQSTT